MSRDLALQNATPSPADTLMRLMAKWWSIHWFKRLNELVYSVRRWLGSARTLASLFGSFAAESGAVVVGAKRGRTVRCHFRGPRRQTGCQRWCDLHHQGIVRLAQPEREVHHGNTSAWCEDPSVFFPPIHVEGRDVGAKPFRCRVIWGDFHSSPAAAD